MIVVDASALLEVILVTPRAGSIEAILLDPDETLHAPHLIDVEVAQVLRRYEAAGDIDAARGQQALDDLAGIRLERHPHLPFLGRAWQLRRNLTAYDALYIALAEALPARLLTCDATLASAPGHEAKVVVL